MALLLTIIVGSLWTAAHERELRLLADQAEQQAKLSEQKTASEAERAIVRWHLTKSILT